MSASAADVARLRRLVNEPTEDTYDDDTMGDYLERYPLIDSEGYDPDDDDWADTYDMHAAAADIWEEKAAVVAVDFAFQADGGSYSRDQVYQQYMKQARYHRGKRSITTITARMEPRIPYTQDLEATVNMVDPDEDWPL